MTPQQQLILEAQEVLASMNNSAASLRGCLQKAVKLESDTDPSKDRKQAIRSVNLSYRLRDALRTARTACQSIETTLKYAKDAVDAEDPVKEVRLPGA